MNNWAFVGKTKVSPLIIVKIQRKNTISNLPKEKEDKEIKLSSRNKEKKEILEEIDNGRNRVKKDSRILRIIFTVGL